MWIDYFYSPILILKIVIENHAEGIHKICVLAKWHFSDDLQAVKYYDVEGGKHLFPAGFLQIGTEFVEFGVVVSDAPDLVHSVDHVDVREVVGSV